VHSVFKKDSLMPSDQLPKKKFMSRKAGLTDGEKYT
jgi:hypothetical protein